MIGSLQSQYPQNTLVLNSPEDIPDGMIGARFYYYDPETYKRLYGDQVTQPTTESPQIPMSAPIGRTVSKPGIKTTLSMSDTASQVPKAKKPSAWSEKDIYGRNQTSNLSIGVAYGAQAAANTVQNVQQANVAQYNTDVDYWNQQGKWWFDKNAEFAPSFEDYAPNMPSAEKAVGGAGGAIGGGALKGAATGASIGAMTGNPVGIAVGAGVGALVGAIEGIFTLKAAQEADRKNLENSHNEYKKQLKEWTYSMNARLNQSKNTSEESQKGFIAQAGQLSISRKKEKAFTAEQKRQAILQSIMGSGDVAQSKRSANKARWS